MVNRLAQSMSPYLQQHADNPVDWYAWGSEAFAAARERNVPILLSVGYAACHWCHVMAHESFEDAATAAYMNEHFVNVKVDREEHPDVDSVYMSACVSMTGQGGWPLTCVLDHDGAPFFSGTYFPPRPVHGRPAFTQVLQALSDAWSHRGDEVREVAGQITDHLRALARVAPGELDPDALPGLLAGAVAALERDFDAANGGFGGAPKFPPSMILDFLARRAAHAAPGSAEADSAQRMHATTCEAMARSGTYDQLGGGFARYAVDAGWVVPHFEKMLYDNAQLLSAYAHWDAPLGRRVAAETADFLLRDLRTDQGGFASSLDADTDGVEGAFYVWTPAELDRVLGEDDGAWAAALFGVTEAGTFEHGASTLQLRSDPDPAEDGRFDRVRAALLDARAQRTAPARDDKVVAAWNGLVISGLCAAAAALDEPRYLDAALAAADLLVRVHLDEPSTEPAEPGTEPAEPGADPADRAVRLRRVSRDGRATGTEGVLEDYGCVAQAFGDLAQATGDPVWVDRAGRLLARVRAAFLADDGGFFDTATASDSRDTGQPTLLTRPRDLSDNASPCGASAAAHAFLTYAALTGDRTAYEVAVRSLGPAVAVIAQAPRFAGWFAAACDTVQQGPLEVAVIGEPGHARDALATEARRWPGAVVVTARPEDTEGAAIELVRGRGAVEAHPTAYVCRQQVCAAPVTSVEDLRAALRA